jgi:hypothetical protein
MAFRSRLARAAGTALALVSVVVGLTTATASADTADPFCGPITANVRLTHDVTCPGALIFEKSATVDLAGHTLTAYEIDAPFGFGDPLDATFVSGRVAVASQVSGALHFDRVAISGDLSLFVGSVTLERSILNGSIINAFDPSGVGVDASSSLILGGITAGGRINLHHDTIVGIVAGADGDRGPLFAVTDNVILGGITAFGDSGFLDIGGDISRNVIIGGKIGFGVNDVAALTIGGNVVIGSPSSGIDVSGTGEPSGGRITLTGNLAVANQGHGINVDAPAGVVVDGGGNRAFLNHTQPQCIGVVCRGLF